MTDQWREKVPQLPSKGKDVMDFFGNLEKLDKGVEYKDSLDPSTDVFSRFDNAQQIVEEFAKLYPTDLDYIKPRLDEFFGITEDTPQEEKPKIYVEAVSTLQAEIEKRKPKVE
jgi:hypothetical protein